MNLGHISHHFRPLCQGCARPYYALPFDDILCDVSCTCIVDHLVLILNNFDNKHTFIVYFIYILGYLQYWEMVVETPPLDNKVSCALHIRYHYSW